MTEKRAPVQGYSAGIPWSMHLRAYDAYCKKWGSQPAMIDLEGRNCRGGFSTGELDDFIPGWRSELSLVTQLRAALEPFAAISLHRDAFPDGPDMIEGPDLAITPDQVRAARKALSAGKSHD
jgi:hypothetical protein